jgi:hypothetical protein
VVASDGVRKSVWWIAAAVASLALALLLLVRLAAGPGSVALSPPPPASRAIADAPIESRREDPPAKRSHRARRIEPAPAAASAPAAGSEPRVDPPEREDPPFSIGAPGTGIALFPSRDTKPIKSGIVVPDDFELPEGYVRHFQANEDGELVAPILLFHPDYEIVDEAGEVMELPPDRVVPPELAPEGLPIQMLEVPGAKGDAR